MNNYIVKAQVRVRPYQRKGKYVIGYTAERKANKRWKNVDEWAHDIEAMKEKIGTYEETRVGEKGSLYGRGEYKVTQHPENKKWYVFGHVGKGQWMQITSLDAGVNSKEEALKNAERYKGAERSAKQEFLEEGLGQPTALYGAELLSPEEEAKLAKQYRKTGDIEARNTLVVSNQKLISKVATDVLRRYRALNDDNLDELQQVGNEVVMESLKTFDPNKGRLTTYLMMPLKTYMQRRIEQILNIGQIEESEWRDASGKEGEEEISRIASLPSGGPTPEEETVVKQRRDQLERVMHLLSDKERQVVQDVFWGDQSVEEVAQKMKLTRIRIYQILNSAKAKLKKKLTNLQE